MVSISTASATSADLTTSARASTGLVTLAAICQLRYVNAADVWLSFVKWSRYRQSSTRPTSRRSGTTSPTRSVRTSSCGLGNVRYGTHLWDSLIGWQIWSPWYDHNRYHRCGQKQQQQKNQFFKYMNMVPTWITVIRELSSQLSKSCFLNESTTPC